MIEEYGLLLLSEEHKFLVSENKALEKTLDQREIK
jgi:hypothetical protein